MFLRSRKSMEEGSRIEDDCLCHDLQAGDHVYRWSNLIIYPIQIHGIVLSAGDGIVTIIDFGLSSGHDKKLADVPQDDCGGDQRLNIITLTEQLEVDHWRKVNYGESLLSDGKWSNILSWFQRTDNSSNIDGSDVQANDNAMKMPVPPPDDAFALQKEESQDIMAWLQGQESESENDEDISTCMPHTLRFAQDHYNNVDPIFGNSNRCNDSQRQCNHDLAGNHPHPNRRKSSSPPSLPKSDPPVIVLSRVRFLLSDVGKTVLPPHHLLYANSECIAVWCKTGRYSTIQSQIFLHSTALGNAKTATMLSLMVGSQTVTVTSTIPAAGFWGWLGYTTTTTSQVGLLSMNPWLIPVLAGYGIAAVGTPFFILHQAQCKWEKATSEMNDAFWQNATPDVYVDAIQHWSGLVDS